MNAGYEEILEGEAIQRRAPGTRHELILARLHDLIAAAIEKAPNLRLTARRTLLDLTPGDWVHPDLAILDASTGQTYLVAEVIDARDHSPDTVIKKRLYEKAQIPRVWMIDPRYNNAEIYHATPHGLALKGIYAGGETLTDDRLPGFHLTVEALFA